MKIQIDDDLLLKNYENGWRDCDVAQQVIVEEAQRKERLSKFQTEKLAGRLTNATLEIIKLEDSCFWWAATAVILAAAVVVQAVLLIGRWI